MQLNKQTDIFEVVLLLEYQVTFKKICCNTNDYFLFGLTLLKFTSLQILNIYNPVELAKTDPQST